MSTAAGIPIGSLSSDLTVINRAGERIELDIRRIRRVIDHCCSNLNVNPLELESSLKTRLKNGITTREIQENLIQCAKELTSAEAPDWRYVAGRLLIWGYRKEILIHRGSEYDGTANSILEKCKAGIYDSRLLEYSYQDLLTAQSWINPELDWDYDLAGANLLLNRYLLPGELPQEAFLICCLLLALPERPENRLTVAELFYEQISNRKVSLPTPILANLRIPNGSLSSCFITAMDDDLESIFETVKNAARISKNGGGIGCNVSRIRAMGSSVMGKQNASGGVVPWIKLLNDTAIAVNQGGRRAGAITVSLDVWHLDILEFLEMQTENGDQRRKAYDIFPQVVISDEFMRRVINKEDWILVDPYEVRTKLGFELAETWGSLFEESYSEIEAKIESEITLYRRINARELFKMIMRCQIETGLPYLFFKDTANRANPNQHEGYIPCGNLCQESWSNVKPEIEDHVCSLTSVNLANINHDCELEKACRTAVRLIDNSIDLTHPPTIGSKTHNSKYRTAGVGVMGLADWLARRKYRYTNLAVINTLFEDISFFCTDASADLAIHRGAYPAFAGSSWSQGRLLGNKSLPEIVLKSSNKGRWLDLQLKILDYGIRNSQVMAIAPNTSSALVQGCTAGILPPYGRFVIDKSKVAVPIAPPYLEEFFWFYPENKTLNQHIIVDAVAAMQFWVDTGISMELNFNLNAGVYFPEEPQRYLKASDIYDVLISAWEQGCKAIYYIRTVQKDSFEDSCVSCAN